jgi:glyoxylase-like metal-dependent hydrolase (beta-lactamase superfamily II)
VSATPPTTSDLHYKVLTQRRPGLSRDLPPGKEDLMWVANSSTLIYGKHDAVLVDTFLTKEQSQHLVDWVVESGKNLTAIYITHGHGDHIFGIADLQVKFPKARAVAIPEVVKAMPAQWSQQYLDDFWLKLFPGNIPEHFVVAEPLANNELELEGERLVAVPTGQTDTTYSAALHVPAIDLVVSGDAVYNGIHPYLAETTKESRLDWVAALDAIAALRPKAVVAGHKVPENDDSPKNIGETRQYLVDFARLDDETTDAQQLYDEMLKLYPNRANPGSLWGAAHAAKKKPA